MTRWLVILNLPRSIAEDSQALVKWVKDCLPDAEIVAYQEIESEETETEK